MPGRLEGKVALITGATRGLGLAMAEAFAMEGATIAVVSRKAAACDDAAKRLNSLGANASAHPCHIGRWDAIEPMAREAWDRWGRVDILVNNAGMSPLYPSLDQVSEELFDKVVSVNFKGPFRLMALIGGWMRAGEGGSIINISSIASLEASPTALPYAGAKAALNALTLGFSAALSPNVRVNTLCVGPFATDVAEHWPDPPDHAHPGWTKSGMRVGLPSEITAAALYLASEASSFTNGALLRIDGGPVRARRRAGDHLGGEASS